MYPCWNGNMWNSYVTWMDRKVALPCLATLLYLSTGHFLLDMKPLGIIWIADTAGFCCGPCNPSKWEADMRSGGLLCFTIQWTSVRTELADSMVNLGEPGGLGVERWQLCLQDTSRSANCHRRAAVGHWISLCVKCCRMVDSVPIWHTISIL